MSQAAEALPPFRTVADLLHRLGDIPPDRVRLRPTPGEATERDLLGPDGRLCELVEGVLVEKAMGYDESLLAMELGALLHGFVKRFRLGDVTGPDGTMRLMPGLVRIPDIAFISRKNLPKKGAPRKSVPDLAPDLAVEVLSKANTKGEMKRKLREYFDAGVRMVWLIDPKTRTALVHTSPKAATKLVESQSLDGGDVLPGFTLPLRELFECLDRGRDD
jgi:Uma2 family endonuclease